MQSIILGSSLPQITNSVIIDGTTQNNTSGPPQIAVNGSGLFSGELDTVGLRWFNHDRGLGNRGLPEAPGWC